MWSLNHLGIKYYSNTNTAMCFCPRCKENGYTKNKRKLSIDLEKGIFNCWVCGYSGTIAKLYKDYSIEYDKEFYTKLKNLKHNENQKITSDFTNMDYYRPLNTNDLIYQYLSSKNITYDKCLKYNISVNVFNEYEIAVPSFDMNLNINALWTKNIENHRYNITNKDIIFNEYNFDFNNEEFFIVESPLDAIFLDIKNVIVTFGSKSKLNLFSRLFSFIYNNCKNKKIMIMYDDDALFVADELKKFINKYIISKINIKSFNSNIAG